MKKLALAAAAACAFWTGAAQADPLPVIPSTVVTFDDGPAGIVPFELGGNVYAFGGIAFWVSGTNGPLVPTFVDGALYVPEFSDLGILLLDRSSEPPQRFFVASFDFDASSPFTTNSPTSGLVHLTPDNQLGFQTATYSLPTTFDSRFLSISVRAGGLLLDNVVILTPVPEPAAWALTILGTALLGATLRYRRVTQRLDVPATVRL